MKFPHPKNQQQYFIFKDGKFENVFNKNEISKLLVYSQNFDGWNNDLTKIKTSMFSTNHPIDKASIHLCNYMLENYNQKKNNVILEIGCLNGELTKNIIEQKKYKYIGSDASQNTMIELSKKYKDTPFIVFDITQNPFKNSVCDVLIMLNVLEHIENDDRALIEAFNLLNDNGTLIIEVPSFKILYDDYDKKLLHYRRYDPSEIENKIINAGFYIEKKTHLGFFAFPIFALIKLFNKFVKIDQIVEKEIKISNNFKKKNLEREIKKNIKDFLKNEKIKKVKNIKILNLWVVSQFKDEYNPIHYHDGDISGVGYLKVPKNMTKNKLLKNKKDKTNGTIDFINGQRGFLSRSIFNIVPKERDLIIFPNYLMHTAYPFNINAERRSFSFNAKIILDK